MDNLINEAGATKTPEKHITVLLDEAVNGLAIKSDGIYIDGTFGRGGHSRHILKQLGESGQLIAIDRDPRAIATAQKLMDEDPRFSIVHGPFSNLASYVNEMELAGKIDGILLDLGVSSPQLDDAERGFSFMRDGPLDMRMDQSQTLSAATFIAEAEIGEIAKVLQVYGEEKFARLIASRIIDRRETHPFETTKQLADFIEAVIPKRAQNNKAGGKSKHAATRSFQAIRIHVNNELGDVERLLDDAINILKVGGRLVIISFHSLEDRMVKRFIRAQEKGPEVPRHIPVISIARPEHFISVGKAVKAGEHELDENIRSRSAVLRIAEKAPAVEGVTVEMIK